MEFSPSVRIELRQYVSRAGLTRDKMSHTIIRLFFRSHVFFRRRAKDSLLESENGISVGIKFILASHYLLVLLRIKYGSPFYLNYIHINYTLLLYYCYIIVIYYCNIVIMYKFLPSVVQIYSADAIKKKKTACYLCPKYQVKLILCEFPDR